MAAKLWTNPSDKTVTLQLRVTPAQRDTWNAHADVKGRGSLSALIRDAVDEHIKNHPTEKTCYHYR